MQLTLFGNENDPSLGELTFLQGPNDQIAQQHTPEHDQRTPENEQGDRGKRRDVPAIFSENAAPNSIRATSAHVRITSRICRLELSRFRGW